MAATSHLVIAMRVIALSTLALGLWSCTTPLELYFIGLCNQEAFEEIHQIVENVDSVFQMRIPERYEKRERPNLYDKSGKWAGHKPSWPFSRDPWVNDYPANYAMFDERTHPFAVVMLTPVTNYRFEGHAPPGSAGPFVESVSRIALVRPCQTYRCYADAKLEKQVRQIPAITSRYGYTWQEIYPPQFADRIVGVEFRIVELASGRVIARARDFVSFSGSLGTEKFPGGASLCQKRNGSYARLLAQDFVAKVLRPPLTRMQKLYE